MKTSFLTALSLAAGHLSRDVAAQGQAPSSTVTTCMIELPPGVKWDGVTTDLPDGRRLAVATCLLPIAPSGAPRSSTTAPRTSRLPGMTTITRSATTLSTVTTITVPATTTVTAEPTAARTVTAGAPIATIDTINKQFIGINTGAIGALCMTVGGAAAFVGKKVPVWVVAGFGVGALVGGTLTWGEERARVNKRP